MPFVLQSQRNTPWVAAAQRVAPFQLRPDTSALQTPPLSAIAQPIEPEDPPTAPVQLDSLRMAALVAGEDLRLRTLLHHIGRITYPEVVQGAGRFDTSSGVMTGGNSTLILPGPASYTIADLQAAGAVVPLTQGGFLLVNNVLVGAGASLTLGGSGVPTLLMESTSSGFTSLVTWGGTITLTGESVHRPMSIMSWDKKANMPADGRTYGRSYIRAVGGRLDLKYVTASYLGFWSGRTGGVAWTGISSRASTGSAVSSRFTSNTYGAFVSHSDKVQFADDLFQQNQLDGLRLHRGTSNAVVERSAAARNGGNGFVISRGATSNLFSGDLAVNNASNGFLINGQSLVSGAGPSGGQTTASVGTIIEQSEAQKNGRSGILVEGGAGTIIRKNLVCSPMTGIAVRMGASGTFVVDNDVRCGRVSLSIGPQVTGTTVFGNSLRDGRIAILIRNSPGVRIMFNQIQGMSVFGISVRGQSPGIVGNDNIISGRGFRPIDVRAGAGAPVLKDSDVTGWQHQSTLTPLAYLRYHPLMTTWLAILVFVVLCAVVVRLRRRPERAYFYAVPWRPADQFAASPQPLAATAPMPAMAAAAAAPAFATVAKAIRAPAAAVAATTVAAPPPALAPPRRAEPQQAPAAPLVPAPNPMLWRPFAKFATEPPPTEEPATPPAAKPTRRRQSQTATNGAASNGSAAKEAKTRRPAEVADLVAAAAPVEANRADHKPQIPPEPPGSQFWRWLAAGNWAGEERNSPKVADSESRA